MPENALEDARFDHVSETGELVFVSGAGKFAVKVDEALERAILEAKQIRTETQEERQQQAPSTLPKSNMRSNSSWRFPRRRKAVCARFPN